MIEAISQYFTAILIDGDWLNDWLTHLPEYIRPLIMALGQLVAAVIGS